MNKRVTHLLIIFLFCKAGHAQPVTDSIHPLFKELSGDAVGSLYDNFEIAIPTHKPGKHQLYNNVELSLFHSKNLYVNTVFNTEDDLSGLRSFKNETSVSYAQLSGAYKNTSAVPLFDSVPIVVTAYGIDSLNKHLYRFRVLQNGVEEIVPWSEVKFFCPVFMHYRYNVDGSIQTKMAYMGEFATTLGNSITVEVKNVKLPDTTYTISAVWIKRAPEVIATFTAATIKEFIAVYKYQWKYDRQGADGPSYYGDISLPPVDSLLTMKQAFTHHENDLFIYLNDKVKSASLVEYNLVSNSDSSGWMPNNFDPNVIWLQQLAPGNYTLRLRYAFQRQSVNSFSFTIAPAWYQTVWFKTIGALLLLTAFASVYLVIKNRRQKITIRQQQTQQQLTQAEIKSIRSQFNPHFVFNALNSIQGLITQNDMEAAHQYLSSFSQLLRNSLKESEKEFISLSTDISLIDNYLKLEQLRFGFQYSIHVDEQLQRDAIEIPVLLLQPVVENAVKHGIAHLYERGVLTINYTASKNNMLITITDNGARYTAGTTHTGLGLKLTNERIILANRLLKEQSIQWKIINQGDNTQVTFVFENWLL